MNGKISYPNGIYLLKMKTGNVVRIELEDATKFFKSETNANAISSFDFLGKDGTRQAYFTK